MTNWIPATTIAVIFGLSAASSARQIENWPYEKLLKEADLVVIAHAVSTAPSEDKWEGDLFAHDRFIGLETTFELVTVLKGQSADDFKLLHFQYKNQSKPFNDGPGLVSFLTEPLSVDIIRSNDSDDEGLKRLESMKRSRLTSAPEYLLFLKRKADGRFEAVSGQVDPNSSVRTLFKRGKLARGN